MALSNTELDDLAKIVARGNYPEFAVVAVFNEFAIANDLPGANVVATDGTFSDFFLRYASYVNDDGQSGRLVAALYERCEKSSPHKAERLLDLMEPDAVEGTKWIYLGSTASAIFDLFDRQAMFAALADYRRFVRPVSEPPSELAIRQIELSGCYFLVLTEEDVATFRDEADSTFAHVFDRWAGALEERPADRKRLIVFAVGQKAKDWWLRWKRERFLEDGAGDTVQPLLLFERSLDTIPNALALAPHRDALSGFLQPIPAQETAPVCMGKIIVLGDPLAVGGRSRAINADQRRQDQIRLVEYLVKRAGSGVYHWQDGWVGGDRFDAVRRTRFFQENPVLVRAMPEDASSEFRDLLIDSLATRLGYTDPVADAVWLEAIAKLRKVFWRTSVAPFAEVETDVSGEIALTGSIDGIGARLAEIAGFPPATGLVVSARYENLREDHPQRELLSSKLKEIRKSAADEGSTVAVSLDVLDDSVRRFNGAALNIVAAHDLATRARNRADTMRHFAKWEGELEKAVQKYFPNRRPKILRIAALLNNFNEFEGLKFEEESPVWRWNLLKLEPKDESFVFNPATIDNIQQEARALLSQ